MQTDFPRAAGVNGGTQAPNPQSPVPTAPEGGPPPVPPTPQRPVDRPDDEPPLPEAGDTGPQPPDGEPAEQVARADWPLRNFGPHEFDGVPFDEQKALDDYLTRHEASLQKLEGASDLVVRCARFEAASMMLMAAYGRLFDTIASALSLLSPKDLDGLDAARTLLADGARGVERAAHPQQPPAE